jgi:hypothetical protein
MKKRKVNVPLASGSMLDRMLETTRTISYRRAMLGSKEFNRRKRNAIARTAGTRRAQNFVAFRLDELLKKQTKP